MERIRPMQCGGLGLHELEESEDEVGGLWDQPVKGLLCCAEGFRLNQVSEREHYQLQNRRMT